MIQPHPSHQAVMGKLPAEGTQARRFGKTRSAQATALLEDYVELIADLLESEGERGRPISPAASASLMPPRSRPSRG